MQGIGSLPEIDDLRCFLAAAETLNFRRAAGVVGLTPAAFGHRIRKLEDRLGHELFARTTRSVELTAAGHRLVPVARDALAGVEACVRTLESETNVRFTLGTRFELGVSWIVPALTALSRERPDLRVSLYFGSGPDIIERLANGDVDAIVTSAPVARTTWRAEVLHDERYVFVGAPELLAEAPLRRPDDACRHTLLDVDAELPLTRYLTSVVGHLDFADVRLCGAGMAMRSFALAGMGVAVLPLYMVEADIEAGSLQTIWSERGMLSDSFRLIFPDNSPIARTMRWFAEFLRGRELK